MSVRSSQAAIARWNGTLRALRLPDVAEPRRADGPLRDIAISLKDVIDVAGWTVTCNHRPFAARRAERDAPIVAELRRAGAWLAGASATLEFAYGGFSDGALYEPARNPWNPERSPGGSSCGAGAAVAAGLCDAAIATDTSGSVRGPAAFCGVLGLKLSHGSVAMDGIHPLASTLDCAGVLARGTDVLTAVSSIMCRRDLDSNGARLRRIGWLAGFDADAGVAPETALACRRARARFEALGVELRTVKPRHDLRTYHAACIVILLYEAWHIHAPRLRAERDGYCPLTWARLALGAAIADSDYAAAIELRRRLRGDIDRLLDEVDLLALAGAPSGAPEIGSNALFGMLEQRFLTAPASVTGHPALSLPIGFDDDCLPLALQLIGAMNDEACLLRAAELYCGTAERHLRPPAAESDSRPCAKDPLDGAARATRPPERDGRHVQALSRRR